MRNDELHVLYAAMLAKYILSLSRESFPHQTPHRCTGARMDPWDTWHLAAADMCRLAGLAAVVLSLDLGYIRLVLGVRSARSLPVVLQLLFYDIFFRSLTFSV